MDTPNAPPPSTEVLPKGSSSDPDAAEAEFLRVALGKAGVETAGLSLAELKEAERRHVLNAEQAAADRQARRQRDAGLNAQAALLENLRTALRSHGVNPDDM